MQSTDDSARLREFAENNSEDAFASLVAKHVNLVYSVAMRSAGNPSAAEEITQVVFIILARKAGQLRNEKALSSWLFQTTRLAANNFLRSEMRRQRREQEAHDMQTILNEPELDIWPRIAPLLDTAVAALNEKDRRAILLRFYEGKNLREIGTALGASEVAAEKRVSRAIEKLQNFFLKRGITSTAGTITGAISANSIQIAPALLAKTTTAVALAKGSIAVASTLSIVNGTMKTITWLKLKWPLASSVTVLLTAGLVAIAFTTNKPADKPKDLISFFKQALSSPPDIESFAIGQRSLQPPYFPPQVLKSLKFATSNLFNPEMQFYTGARGGTNFYITMPPYTNSPGTFQQTIGRAGATTYETSENAISYGYGTNALTGNVQMEFTFTRQLLDFGIGDIEPDSVVWNGIQFRAQIDGGFARYGELELSNNLPFILKISYEKGSAPFKTIEYTYPDPPISLGGFPRRMILSSQTDEGMKPSIEIVIQSIRLATRPLAADFFSETQFKTKAIRYTNIYTGEGLFVGSKNGKTYLLTTNKNGKTVALPRSPFPK